LLNSEARHHLAGGLWARGALHGKVGGAFTSTATQHGGQEVTLFSIIANLMHFGLMIVGLPYSHQGQGPASGTRLRYNISQLLIRTLCLKHAARI
jgi:multimeric flavodoxin WrbA